MKTKVYVIKKEPNETDQDIINRTLQKIQLEKIITNSEKMVLINPNWVCSDHFTSGNVTSTDTLEGIVSYLIEKANIQPSKIIVADGGQSKGTSKVIKLNNVRKLEEYGIKVMDLNSDKRENDVKPSNALALKTVNIAKTAMEARFELGGSPVQMDLIMAGEDPVGVDTVGSAIIGYTPKEARYLKYGEQKGLGIADLSNIEIIGAPIEEVYHKF